MFDKALEVIKDEIQGYLKLKPDLNITTQDTVYLSNIVDAEGKIEIPDESLGMTLVNIEEERVLKSQTSAFIKNGNVRYVNPELKFNLYVLITAHFKGYTKALKFLSNVVMFFQGKYVFNHANTPGLSPEIDKLIADIYTITFEQQNYLWGAVGGKMLPSVMYKIRMITVQEDLEKADVPAITVIGDTVNPI